jgi:hypothetical protein
MKPYIQGLLDVLYAGNQYGAENRLRGSQLWPLTQQTNGN